MNQSETYDAVYISVWSEAEQQSHHLEKWAGLVNFRTFPAMGGESGVPRETLALLVHVNSLW